MGMDGREGEPSYLSSPILTCPKWLLPIVFRYRRFESLGVRKWIRERERERMSVCYRCNEVGHFARQCPWSRSRADCDSCRTSHRSTTISTANRFAAFCDHQDAPKPRHPSPLLPEPNQLPRSSRPPIHQPQVQHPPHHCLACLNVVHAGADGFSCEGCGGQQHYCCRGDLDPRIVEAHTLLHSLQVPYASISLFCDNCSCDIAFIPVSRHQKPTTASVSFDNHIKFSNERRSLDKTHVPVQDNFHRFHNYESNFPPLPQHPQPLFPSAPQKHGRKTLLKNPPGPPQPYKPPLRFRHKLKSAASAHHTTTKTKEPVNHIRAKDTLDKDLIISGLPESQNSDEDSVRDVLDHLAQRPRPLTLTRIGDPRDPTLPPRPIRATFSTCLDRDSVFRSKTALKESPFSHIFLALPLSKSERYIAYMKRCYAREKSSGDQAGRLIVSRSNGRIGRLLDGKPDWDYQDEGFRSWLQAKRSQNTNATSVQPQSDTAHTPLPLQPPPAPSKPDSALLPPSTPQPAHHSPAKPPRTPDTSQTTTATPASPSPVSEAGGLGDSFMSARDDNATPVPTSPQTSPHKPPQRNTRQAKEDAKARLCSQSQPGNGLRPVPRAPRDP